jgi:hypothetical protein
MKQKILQIEDTNMAGFEWSYSFWLSRTRDRSLTLALKQSAKGADRLHVDPEKGLKSGIDVYRALRSMLSEAGSSIDSCDPDSVARAIGLIDPVVAAEFRNGATAIESEEEEDEQEEYARRREIVAPFNSRIEAYVTRFSAERLHYPGAGEVYPSRRHWATKFIQEYVVAHGALPTGKHWIRVQGYSGDEHDFSDI